MTHMFDATGLLSLVWPLVLCAAAWGIMVWSLRQPDTMSEAVNSLLASRHSGEAGAAANPSDPEREKHYVERCQRKPRIGRSS